MAVHNCTNISAGSQITAIPRLDITSHISIPDIVFKIIVAICEDDEFG